VKAKETERKEGRGEKQERRGIKSGERMKQNMEGRRKRKARSCWLRGSAKVGSGRRCGDHKRQVIMMGNVRETKRSFALNARSQYREV